MCWHEHTRDGTVRGRQSFNYGVGFTAIVTKYLTHDPRFLGAAARSVPLALARRHRYDATASSRLPNDLARVERQGMLSGAWLYARSRLWGRELKLYDVIKGR